MTTRSVGIRAWCVQVWRCVLQAVQVMAQWDASGQFIGLGPPRPVVPTAWAYCTSSVQGPRAALTAITQRPVTERPRAFTPKEWARLCVLRARYQADRTRFTTRELAHLRFVRWLHQTGRVMR
jgi:hypothetical protein